jgi:hypothetical protein
MKIEIPCTKKIEVTAILFEVPINDDLEPPFPKEIKLLDIDGEKYWQDIIDLSTGKLSHWPQGISYDFYDKIRDSGTYKLLDPYLLIVKEIQDYVPNGIIPGEYGDYMDLQIDENGIVKNWPKEDKIHLKDFFEVDDE